MFGEPSQFLNFDKLFKNQDQNQISPSGGNNQNPADKNLNQNKHSNGKITDDVRLQRMHERENRKWYLFYPEDKNKQRWDMLMTWCLIFTCCSTPLFISFHEDGPTISNWEVVNIVVDAFFAIDIVVVFFSAFHDEDFQITDDLSDIARNYIIGWFFLDALAITPFDKFAGSSEEDSAAAT